MSQQVDPHLWLQSLLYWLLLVWYGLVIFALVALFATLPLRPLTSLEQIPWWSWVLALGLIAGTYQSVANYLSRGVHHLVYGQHDDAYQVIERMNQELESQPRTDALLPTLAATLADTLKLPYVSIQVAGEGAEKPLSTTYGRVPDQAELVTLPLRYHDLTLGTLCVSARRRLDRLSTADLRLVEMLARQVGITLHAAQLTDALQTSRAQLVTLREEERRRIRRDLHDGLGPTLASLHLQLSALGRSIGDNPEALHQINELRQDVRTTTAEVRRIVYDLRPPMLDEFGLLDALRNLDLADNGLERIFEAPTTLPPLPAAVEVAVYRIAAESLYNIARHAQATCCIIRLELQDQVLILSVIDNGNGLPATYFPGVGHHSMHERAAELGGHVTITTASDTAASERGTCVKATFPLRTAHHV
jgi:two-component system, NarL family, sensor kinase